VFRVRVREGGLDLWLPLRDAAVGAPLDELLREESRARIAARLESRLSDYRLADDGDGAFLAGLKLRPIELHNTVMMIVEAASQRGNGYWLEWLNNIASSPLREQLPLDTKLAVSETKAREWEDFSQLWGMFLGQAEPSLKPPEDSDRRSMLMSELACMARERLNGKAPHLSGIVKALGRLSDEATEALKRLKPKLDFQIAGRWTDGWSALGDKEFAAFEGRRLVTQSNNPLPEKFTLGQYALADEEQLTPLFEELLFNGPPLRDSVYRDRIRVLFERGQHLELLRPSLQRAVADAIKFSRDTNVFARRFVDKRDLLDLIFGCLTREQAVWLMAAAALGAPEDFDHEAYGFCTLLLSEAGGARRRSDGFASVNFGTAFCSFLLSPEGAVNKRRLSSDPTLGPDGRVEKALRAYLAEHTGDGPRPSRVEAESDEEAEKESEAGDEGEASRRREPPDARDEAEGDAPSPPPREPLLNRLWRRVSVTYMKAEEWLQGDGETQTPADESEHEGAASPDAESGGLPDAAPADEPQNEGRTADPQVTS
jgi:hypothetical protein